MNAEYNFLNSKYMGTAWVELTDTRTGIMTSGMGLANITAPHRTVTAERGGDIASVLVKDMPSQNPFPRQLNVGGILHKPGSARDGITTVDDVRDYMAYPGTASDAVAGFNYTHGMWKEDNTDTDEEREENKISSFVFTPRDGYADGIAIVIHHLENITLSGVEYALELSAAGHLVDGH